MLSQEEFQAIQEFLYRHTGITLPDSKRYLVQSRLSKLLSEIGMSTFSELVCNLTQDTLPVKSRTRLIDAMTTHETFWFRDPQQFELLQNRLLPELSRRLRPIRIWSAACSTGQEPYSISLCVHEAMRLNPSLKVDVQILATDLAHGVLEVAKQAIYSDLATARGLSQELKRRYFLRHQNGWRLNPEVTRLVRFQQFNLLNPFVSLGKFDLIFCRNVLIYFSPEHRHQILERMAEILNPQGYLFLSSTESLPPGLDSLFQISFTHGVRYYTRTF
ncbi:MAG: CheR family methyltransferase [Methylohalobius sp.]